MSEYLQPAFRMLCHVFIQSLLSRRAMPADVAMVMYRRAIGIVTKNEPRFVPRHPANVDGLAAFLDEISSQLEPIGLAVKRGYAEDNGRQWIAICNAEAGEVAQLATDLTPLEISYVRELIGAIVASYPANSVGSANALRLTSDLQGQMTKAAAEQLLMALVSRGWFAKSPRGRYSLGTRALMELEHYIREEFEDAVNDCKRCERVMMTGRACINGECGVHLHGYCYKQMQRAKAKCPGCKGELAEFSEVGEGAVPRNQDTWASGAGRRRRPRQSGEAEEEEEEDELDSLPAGTQESALLERRAVEEEDSSLSQRHGETLIPDSIADYGTVQ